MTCSNQLGSFVRLPIVAIAISLIMAAPVAQAQTYTVLHNFNGSDGRYPTSTLILDRAGNLYGTTEYGGDNNSGVVFQLKHTPSGGWIYTPVHLFNGTSNGGNPVDYGGLTLAPDGTIYGTTTYGGILGCNGESYCGTVFRLQPPATACTTALCSWLLSTIYEFNPQSGADFPLSNLIFDTAGNLYGTTMAIGSYSWVYELTPSGGNWTQIPFSGLDIATTAGLVFDNAGNLYGTAEGGTHGRGVVFELTPSGSGWTKTILYNFAGGNDGAFPFGGVVLDSAGNLYGSTTYGGSAGGGTIFELSPSSGGWAQSTLCSFGKGGSGSFGPQSALTMDTAGNLYGTTNGDGTFGTGMVFKATHSGNNWTCTDLFDFQGDLGQCSHRRSGRGCEGQSLRHNNGNGIERQRRGVGDHAVDCHQSPVR